jgi:hypothetical protein
LPNLTDEQIRALEFATEVIGGIAVGGLFEIGLLTYVDDVVRATALLDDVARSGDDLLRAGRPNPSTGPLKNRSGNLDEAAQAARTQPHGPMPEAVSEPGPVPVPREIDDWPELSGMLRDAARGKGNLGVGSATREQIQAMGEAWVGPGHRVASDGKTLISADGLCQFRPPSFKPSLGKVQANFESRPEGLTQWQSNAHVDVLD